MRIKPKRIPANPKVIKLAIIIIKNHPQSPLNKGTKPPKNIVVQENPTGASLTILFLLSSKVIVAKAIIL